MMSVLDDLKDYSYALYEKRAIEQQIERMGTTGAPSGLRPVAGGQPHTNNTAAAANQCIDGLEAVLERKRAELSEKIMRGERALDMIQYPRARVVMRQFYILRQSDARIADGLLLSKKTVQRIRVATERELDAMESG